MSSRQRSISASITKAVLADPVKSSSSPVARILVFFSLFSAPLKRLQANLFALLRRDTWNVSEDEYLDSFADAHGPGGSRALVPAGDLGYSGSVFFTTPDSKFLVKSIDRHFEYNHFEQDMLAPYAAHMRAHAATSLLVRITDFLTASHATLGLLSGLTPPRYVVMENLLGGRDGEPVRSGDWESYDLKPADYFFPERDIADGALASESVKSKLVDRFNDRLQISSAQADDLRTVLASDTALLEALNCVDYSLFLVRYPSDLTRCEPVRSNRTGWREGLVSADGKWRYRLLLLDFFFAKHRLQPRVLTGLVNIFNLVGRKGPMSITTTPSEYRARFLRMVDALIEEV